MADRRPLIEGLKPASPPVDPKREREFMDAAKSTATVATPVASLPAKSPHVRVSISTRIRTEYAEALKRASLQRQLENVEPNTLQDILEEAIEPWLRANGYIR